MSKLLVLLALSSGIAFGIQAADADEYYRGSLKDGPAIVEGYNWSGFYAGAHVGGVWGDASVVDTDGGVPYGAFAYSPSGAFGGGTAGFNLTFDRFLVGVEGDLGYMNLTGDRRIASSDPRYHQDLTLDGGLYGDITGRLGVLVTPATLLYAKGGFAFYDGQAEQATTKPWYKASGTDTFTGYTIGGGIEHFICDRVSIKVEYLHFGFGDEDGSQQKVESSLPAADDGTPVGYKFHNTHSLSADSIKVGLNYHF